MNSESFGPSCSMNIPSTNLSILSVAKSLRVDFPSLIRLPATRPVRLQTPHFRDPRRRVRALARRVLLRVRPRRGILPDIQLQRGHLARQLCPLCAQGFGYHHESGTKLMQFIFLYLNLTSFTIVCQMSFS